MFIDDQISSRIAGPGATSVFLSDIKTGKANKGLSVFLANNSSQSLESGKKFLVKVTLKQAEGQIAKLLAECDDATLDRYELPVPMFYHVSGVDDYFIVYQEFMEGANPKAAWELDLENDLSEAAYRFSSGLERLYSDFGQTPNTIKIFGKGLIRHVEAALESAAAAQMMSLVEQIEPALESLPRVISHNDIAWANIALREDHATAERRITLIDFGMVGRNYAGADFHHFAAAAANIPKRARVFDGLTARTAELYGQPVAVIRAAAFFYAAHRNIVRHIKKENDAAFFEDSLRLLRNAQAGIIG